MTSKNTTTATEAFTFRDRYGGLWHHIGGGTVIASGGDEEPGYRTKMPTGHELALDYEIAAGERAGRDVADMKRRRDREMARARRFVGIIG